jgi:hypothetical protein
MCTLELLPRCNGKRLLLDAHITVCSIGPFHIVGDTGSYSILPRSTVLGGAHLPSTDLEIFLPSENSPARRNARGSSGICTWMCLRSRYFLILVAQHNKCGQLRPLSIVYFFHSKIPRRVILIDKPYIVISLLSIFNTLSNHMLTIPPSHFYLEL